MRMSRLGKRSCVFFFLLSLMLAGCGNTSSNSNLIGVATGSGAAATSTPQASPSPALPAGSPSPSPAPTLSAQDINLIFVISQDLAHNFGDVNTATANLNDQGLQRANKLATYLKATLLESANVTAIYALEPTTHPQTAANLPDMVGIETIEPFALMNQYSETNATQNPPTVVGNSYPLNAAYDSTSVPVTVPTPPFYCATCQGIDFADSASGNEALITSVIKAGQPGYYVFSLPFETFQPLMTNLKSIGGYSYTVPQTWSGPDTLFALAVHSGGSPSLLTFNSNVTPGSAYPTLTPPFQRSVTCTGGQTPMDIQTAGTGTPPYGINVNETVYFVRHGEAHPADFWDDGNLICQGEWRALYMPSALAGLIKTPDYVFAVDPSQLISGGAQTSDPNNTTYAYVRTSQTLAPYAIANNIPFNVGSGFQWYNFGTSNEVQAAVNYFFTGGQFSNKTLLISWEHGHIPPIATALIADYYAANPPTVVSWPGGDYDTIWTFTLDSAGNLHLSNSTCEGIDTTTLPATCPTI